MSTTHFPSWVLGFVDGEGCFHISFALRSKISCKIEVRPSFSVSQKAPSLPALQQIHTYFGCGGIRYSKKDGTYKYEVRTLDDLHEKILPFFKNYRLQTTKCKDFDLFAKVCFQMKQGQHLNSMGIREIIDLAYTMNSRGCLRKYTKEELLKFLVS